MSSVNVKKIDSTNWHIDLSGTIGETYELFHLDFRGVKHTTLNFEKTTYLNSVGVKSWINWLSRVVPPLVLTYTHCPRLIINQINMVAGFLPRGSSVQSFYVPYHCEKCSAEKSLLLESGTGFTAGDAISKQPKINAPDEVKCDKCQSEMEMDVIFASYFKFLEFKE